MWAEYLISQSLKNQARFSFAYTPNLQHPSIRGWKWPRINFWKCPEIEGISAMVLRHWGIGTSCHLSWWAVTCEGRNVWYLGARDSLGPSAPKNYLLLLLLIAEHIFLVSQEHKNLYHTLLDYKYVFQVNAFGWSYKEKSEVKKGKNILVIMLYYRNRIKEIICVLSICERTHNN